MSFEDPVLRDAILLVSSTERKEQMLHPHMSYEKKKRCPDLFFMFTNHACEGRVLLSCKSLNGIEHMFQFEHISLGMRYTHEEIRSSKFSDILAGKGWRKS